jgi:hypothetical protein
VFITTFTLEGERLDTEQFGGNGNEGNIALLPAADGRVLIALGSNSALPSITDRSSVRHLFLYELAAGVAPQFVHGWGSDSYDTMWGASVSPNGMRLGVYGHTQGELAGGQTTLGANFDKDGFFTVFDLE